MIFLFNTFEYPKMIGLIPLSARYFPRYMPVEKPYDVPHTVYDKKKAPVAWSMWSI